MISADQTVVLFRKLADYDISYDASQEIKTELNQATFQVNGNVYGLIQPRSKEEVVLTLKAANELKIPLYPISQGKNWGYGSAVPPGEGAVILSLQKLNKIIDFDDEKGVIVFEAGVTFQQVQNFLLKRKSRWQLNAPGSTTYASIMANMLSRGLLQGPKLEKWKDVIAMEIVLADGEIIRTDDHHTASAYRSVGSGPDLMPLFHQSNLGIVTEMKLKLDLRPHYWQHLHITWKEDTQSFNSVVSSFRKLTKEKIFAGSLAVHSAEKILSIVSQYPYDLSGGQTPLSESLKNQMLNEIAGGDWFAETAIAAPSNGILEGYKLLVTEAFSQLSIDLHWAEVNMPGPVFHYQTETAPAQMYWRKPTKPPIDIKPERDGCGILWLSPVIPWDTELLEDVFENAQSIVASKGFEVLLTFQFPDDNYSYAIISILYDRNTAGEDGKALEAFYELKAFLDHKKYYSYRHSLLEQPMIVKEDDLRIKFKEIMDPNGIIAPDFYIPHLK